MASCWFFFTWPEAIARRNTPSATTPPPTASEASRDAPATNRTRQRGSPGARECGAQCGPTTAILPGRPQPFGSFSSSSAAANSLFRLNRLQARIWTIGVRAVVHAFGTAQHDRAGGERSIAVGASRPEQRHYRNAQRGCQVHGAGIAAHKEAGATSERDQLAHRTFHRRRRLSAGFAVPIPPSASSCGP